MKRKWKRDRTRRVYRCEVPHVTTLIFGADGMSMWAWGVWSSHYAKEGIAYSLKRAKQRAEEQIDAVLLAEESAAGVKTK